ncbi:G-protein coupled receptor 54-like [Convolutriloba macropyga]|uniref:G-protein coupled receptor 54-like n=1 Tax=Convolutriloba macropyga TaxID=536237 RepID=UPI003F523D3C
MEQATFDALSTFFQFVYALICLFGVGGNSLVLLVIASAKQLHTTSNLYIFSMALGDLIFLLVCTPLNIYQIYAKDCWQMGAVACSASFYLMNVSVLVSCFSLCLLSIDRCVALRYPLESIRYRQPSTAIFANMTCWLGAPSGRLKVSHTHIAEVKESTRFNFTPSSGKIAELKLIKECQTKSTIY